MSTDHRAAFAALVAVAWAAAAPVAVAAERWFWLSNQSDFTLTYAYATNVDDRNWGADLIPDDTIAPGYQMRVEPAVHQGYCRFDIRLEFDGLEAAQVINSVNLCEATEVVTYGVRDGSFRHDVR